MNHQKIYHWLHFLKYLNITKSFNFIKLLISYILSIFKINNTKKRNLPFFVSIEPVDFCNLRCPECYTGKNFFTEQKKILDFQNYIKIINELKNTLLHVILYFQGEPLLHPLLPEMIRYAHKAKIYTSLSTNAQLMNEKMAEKLVLSGLDKLIVSLDGTTQEVYETYRKEGNIKKVIEAVKILIQKKKELQSFTPMIEIQFLVLGTNEFQMKEMKKLAKELKVDRLVFKTAQLHNFENGHPLMPQQLRYSRYKLNKNGKYQLKYAQPNRCWRLWSGAVVNVNGDVLPCCFDKSGKYSFGNVFQESFYQSWHSTEANNFRRNILHNRKQYEICLNCTSH